MSKRLSLWIQLFLCSLLVLEFVVAPNSVLGDPPAVPLSAAEEAWLREHPIIRLGVDPDAPPTEFVSKEGDYLGIASDMVRLVNERLGITMAVERGLLWKQVMDKAKAREIDVLPCLARTKDREEYLLFTKPYLNVPVVIITRTDAPYVGGMADLHGKKVAVVQGYQLHERIGRDHPEISLFIVNSTKEALRAVSEGKAFAFPGNLALSVYQIPKLGLSNLKVAAPTEYSYAPSFGVRKDWPELLSILDKTLATVSAEERTAISQKWISLERFYGIDFSLVMKWLGAAGVFVAFVMLWNFQIRRQKKLVKKSEERLQTIMDSIPNVVFVTDTHGKKVLVNREWERVTKRGRVDAVGKVYEELYPERLAEKLHGYDRQVLETRSPLTSEENVRTSEGPRTFVQTLVPLSDASGRPYAICGSATDITDRKRAEDRLQQAFTESNRLLAEAANYVTTLLPEPLSSDHIVVDWRFEPSAALGGDCFGYHWLDPDHFVLYVLDVSGHGVSASLLAVAILNVLRSQTLKHANFCQPGEVLSALNDVFPMEEHNGMYFTMWYGVYEPSSRRLFYSSAGHPPALLFSHQADGAINPTKLQTPHLFIGGLPGMKYETSFVSLTVPCTLYLFSDGVFEVVDRTGCVWGFRNFQEFIGRSFQGEQPVLERLTQHVRSLRQVATLDDDLSIVEVHFP